MWVSLITKCTICYEKIKKIENTQEDKLKHNNNTVLEKGPIGINFDNYFPSHLGWGTSFKFKG